MDPDGSPDRWLTAAMLVPAKPRSAMSAAAASTIFRRDSTPSSSRRDSFRAAPRSPIGGPGDPIAESREQGERVAPLDPRTGRRVEAVVGGEPVHGETG